MSHPVRKIRIGWSCCDTCTGWHRNRFFAFFHYLWLKGTGRAR